MTMAPMKDYVLNNEQVAKEIVDQYMKLCAPHDNTPEQHKAITLLIQLTLDAAARNTLKLR